MVKNYKLAKAIIEASSLEFRRILKYKANWYRGKIIVTDKNFVSSQLCSECSYKNPSVKNFEIRK